jgi:NADPH2:quinone reductase
VRVNTSGEPGGGATRARSGTAKTGTIRAPEGIDPTVAVVIASAVTGFAIKAAEVAGRLAVQVARLLGAGRIVATGRDDRALEDVRRLGADTVINTSVSDGELVGAFTREAGNGSDVILDALWGRPTEALVRSLTPDRLVDNKPVRLVQVGESAGSGTAPSSAACSGTASSNTPRRPGRASKYT